MRTLSRVGITTLLVLLSIPLALAFSGQRRPARPETQRRPVARPPAFAMAGDAEQALSFLERADARVPFSNEIVSATFTATSYEEPSATGDIGRVLADFWATEDELTRTFQVRWRQGAPFDEVVAIRGAHYDPDEMGVGLIAAEQAYFSSVFSFEQLARFIVPPRFSRWLQAPIPPTAEERAAVAAERAALRQRQIEERLAERGETLDDPRARGRGRRPARPVEEEPDGWVDTHDDRFHDYYNGSSILIDNNFLGRPGSNVFNLEATLPDDRGGARAFRLFGVDSRTSSDPNFTEDSAILDAFFYAQEQSTSRPDQLLGAPYHVKWHYPGYYVGDSFTSPWFQIFYNPVYFAQVPPVDHTMQMDLGFGSNDGPQQAFSTTVVRHEWTTVGPYQVPSQLSVQRSRSRADGTFEMFVEPTIIRVSDWEIVTLDGERIRQEPDTRSESAPSLTGDVAEARRLLAAADSRISPPAGDIGRGAFLATYHPHLDNPDARADDYRFSVASVFDRRIPFVSTTPMVGEYFMNGESEGAVYTSAGYNRLGILGLGAELRMMQFATLSVPPSLESFIPADPAGAVTVTVSEDGNLVGISGETGYGSVSEIEIEFDPATKLPLRTKFNAYDVYWDFEPASRDRVRVKSLTFTNVISRMFNAEAGSVVEYEWEVSGGSETLTGMSVEGWDVRLSDWTAVD